MATPRYKVFFGPNEATGVARSADNTTITCKTPSGSGIVTPKLVFYNESGTEIGTLEATEFGSNTFVYNPSF